MKQKRIIYPDADMNIGFVLAIRNGREYVCDLISGSLDDVSTTAKKPAVSQSADGLMFQAYGDWTERGRPGV